MHLTVKTVPAFGFLHWTGKVTLPEIPKVAGPAIDEVIRAAGGAGRPVVGPCIFVYPEGVQDSTTPFTLQIGIEVIAPSQDLGTLKVRRLDPFACGSLIYPGSMKGIHAGYAAADRQMQERRLTRAAEFREVYLRWVEFDSPDNRTEIQLGIAGPAEGPK
jgi:hypothetical protein